MLQQCYMELLKQKEGGNRMNHYEAINDVLVNLFNEILDLEERALITGEYPGTEEYVNSSQRTECDCGYIDDRCE